MIVSESTRSRRLVCRLDPGTDLLAALAELCRAHGVRAGMVRATGTVADATVGARRVDGSAEIVSLTARLGDEVAVWVALATAAGELIGGRLSGGRVVACDVVVDTFDDLRAHPATQPTAQQPAAQPPATQQPAAASSPTFEVPARTSWSDVVAASAARSESNGATGNTPPPVRPASNFSARPDDSAPAEGTTGEPLNVRPGDYIDHPKFGRCAVERVDGDFEFVTARLRNQRLIRLSLDVLTLIPAGQEDGKNVFRAVAGA